MQTIFFVFLLLRGLPRSPPVEGVAPDDPLCLPPLTRPPPIPTPTPCTAIASTATPTPLPTSCCSSHWGRSWLPGCSWCSQWAQSYWKAWLPPSLSIRSCPPPKAANASYSAFSFMWRSMLLCSRNCANPTIRPDSWSVPPWAHPRQWHR